MKPRLWPTPTGQFFTSSISKIIILRLLERKIVRKYEGILYITTANVE
jgi:hypothetical protein